MESLRGGYIGLDPEVTAMPEREVGWSLRPHVSIPSHTPPDATQRVVEVSAYGRKRSRVKYTEEDGDDEEAAEEEEKAKKKANEMFGKMSPAQQVLVVHTCAT